MVLIEILSKFDLRKMEDPSFCLTNNTQLALIDSGGNVTDYIYGTKSIIAKRINNLTYYLLKDHLGSTRVVMNVNNQLVTKHSKVSFR